MDAARIALGIDIGGTWVRAGVVDGDGNVLSRVESPLPAEGDPVLLGQLLAEQKECVLAGAAPPLSAIGVAVPGIWDRQTGVMQQALNLPRLAGTNVVQLFERALGQPVAVETDVAAAGWAQWQAARPRPRRFVYLSLGTGVGGSAILDERLVRHTRGGGGHFGHLIVDTSPDAPLCRCGARGCLEALVSGPALQRAGERKSERAVRALAIGLGQLAMVYAPDVIALGGGVIDAEPGLIELAAAMFRQLGSTLVPAGLRIERAPLSTHEAGVIGAGLLAMEAGRA
jgi:glucokinase